MYSIPTSWTRSRIYRSWPQQSPVDVAPTSSGPCLCDKLDMSPCHRCRWLPMFSQKGLSRARSFSWPRQPSARPWRPAAAVAAAAFAWSLPSPHPQMSGRRGAPWGRNAPLVPYAYRVSPAIALRYHSTTKVECARYFSVLGQASRGPRMLRYHAVDSHEERRHHALVLPFRPTEVDLTTPQGAGSPCRSEVWGREWLRGWCRGHLGGDLVH